MRLDHDPATGVLRLDPAGLDALTAGAAHPEVAAVLANEQWRAAVEDVRDPAATLTLVVAGPEARLVHRGWIRPEGCALLLGVHGDEHQLVRHHPSYLAASLVRVTRMRPRRLDGPRSPVPIDGWTRDHLVDEDPMIRTAALDAAGAGFAWRLDVSTGAGGQSLLVTDGAAGIHAYDADAGVLQPTTSTAVFRVLAAIVPALAATPR